MAPDASGASSSCSSYPLYPSYPNYDVFLNHRGPDLKETFAKDLYRALNSRGLRVFLDKPEMQVGHQITPQIESAIRVASVQVAIFSETYTESKWCLNELVLMADCLIKHTAAIIPVFYDVKPSDVQNKWSHEARDNLRKRKNYDSQVHEHNRPRSESRTIEKWAGALFRVGSISGHELKTYGGDGKQLLDAVVQKVMKSVPKVAKYPTGLKDKLEDFVSQVLSPPEQHMQTKVAKVVGIVGVGGVGKTTLAKEFFVHHEKDYSKSAILFSDVRDDGDRMYSLHLEGKDIEIGGFQEGKSLLESKLRNCRALIILDANIDKNLRDQLADFLQIIRRVLIDPDSLILITSHETQVLITAGIPESSIYQLTGLNDSDSKELFCRYAFNKPDPQRGFENLVDGFVTACCGLPLSLKVFGALVRGEDKERWKEILDGRVHQILPTDIVDRLQRRYHALNAQEKQMFEDIACLSIGNYKDSWIEIWRESGWKDNLVRFQSLEVKSLVDVDRDNTIRMHDELMHFGRRQAKKHHRYLEAAHLSEQSSGIPLQVRGITMAPGSNSRNNLVLCSSNLEPFDEPSSEMQFQLEVVLRWLETVEPMWFRWNDCPRFDLLSSLQMQKLRVLEVDGKELKGLWPCEDQIPVHLRELNVNAPQLKFSNSLGKLSYLTKIVSEETSLETLPEEFCYLPLKYIKLKDFTMVPDTIQKLTIHKVPHAESEDDLTKIFDLTVLKKCKGHDMRQTALAWRSLRARSGIL